MKINEELERLYLNHIDYINKSHSEILNSNIKAEGPFLVKCNETNYVNASKKVVFVGQENNGWTHEIKHPAIVTDKDVSYLMSCYEQFKFGFDERRRPFFGIMHKIIKKCDLNFDSCMYLNIWKYCSIVVDKNRKGTKPSKKLQQITENTNMLIHDELRIFKPDVVVFFTGPNYDNDIKTNVGDYKSTNCLYYGEREMSLLNFENFTFKAIRTYHPGHLRGKLKTNSFIDGIANFINK